MAFKQRLHEGMKSFVERITSPRTVSAFVEKGVLTPAEFVQAGDNLVAKCPTWSWESGDPSKQKGHLPKDKQFLITRNVPCLRRAAAFEEEYAAAGGEVLLDGEDGEGWLATHGAPGGPLKDDDDTVPSMDMADTEDRPQILISDDTYVNHEDDVPDMSDFDSSDNLVTRDETAVHAPYLIAHEPDDNNILRTRTYDISITYDQYFQVPRVWLTGYDESRMLLDPELVFEDVSQDHARQTVTIEDHPHMAGKHASVHPCRHAPVMKKIIAILLSRGVEPEVDKYDFPAWLVDSGHSCAGTFFCSSSSWRRSFQQSSTTIRWSSRLERHEVHKTGTLSAR
ncbi:autophagy-related protein 3 isoform X2 [Selaginella moellendorffii]|uniref:autophagy-related protein 3 isoform X2 n=1 Tax=Selaginella moellendorffii TaxID=88036 RepID=UPI000D1CC9C3|nr:autophagy-related protein 3 isoform X2 [Selaginella moellendorffii]|eukprot:XP_024545006.1 autophagy-related protein 3 isoform X2 [Selaginella moellendorffii]